MKLTTIKLNYYNELRKKFSRFSLLLATFCMLSISAFSQAGKEISIGSGTKTLKEIFSEIEKKSDFIFFYSDNSVDLTKKVDVKELKGTVNQVLDQVLKGAGQFKIEGRQIVVYKDKEPVVQQSAEKAQLTGKVTDSASGEGLPMATVMAKGTNIGVSTDVEGNYSISVPADATLVFSYASYGTVEVPIGGKTVIDVAMNIEVSQLDEVVVVAYGTAKRGSITGAVSALNSKDIESRPITTISKALEGMAPGVQVNSGTGQPGSGVDVRIRGIGSINKSSAPLIVVDGFEFTGSLSDINPDEVDNMTMLKDAASTALYGNRAANGIILITTKKGKVGKINFGVRVSQGISKRMLPDYDLVDAYQFMPIVWENLRNGLVTSGNSLAAANQDASDKILSNLFKSDSNGIPVTNPFNVSYDQIMLIDGTMNPNAKLLYDDFDSRKDVIRIGTRSDYSVNASGANEKSDFFFSVGYLRENGYVKNSDFTRFSGRVSGNIQPRKWVKLGANISATLSKQNIAATGGDANVFKMTRWLAPIYSIYEHDPVTGDFLFDEDGNKVYNYGNDRPFNPNRNTVAETKLNKRWADVGNFTGITYIEFSLLKDLKFNIKSGVEYGSKYSTTFYNPFVGDGERVSGSLYKTFDKRLIWNNNQILTYSKNFDRHHVDVMLGHESQSFVGDQFTGYKTGIKQEGIYEFANFIVDQTYSSVQNSRNSEGYIARANYDYSNKYFLSLSYRRDGSSKFYKDSRWGNFWSIGAGWRVERESFFKVSWVDMLKLRASYGVVGNDDVGNYAWQNLLTSSAGTNNGSAAGMIQETVAGNRLLRWEESATFDVGVDFSLFKGRLSGSIEYFNKNTTDLLFQRDMPLSSGFISQWTNAASLYNRGVELDLTGEIVKNSDFKWIAKFNMTTLVNKVSKLPQDIPASATKKIELGYSVYEYYLPTYVGVDPKNGSVMYLVSDKDKEQQDNGVITGAYYEHEGKNVTNQIKYAGKSFHGSALPNVYGGLSTTFDYKGFSLSFLFTYQLGGKVYETNYQDFMNASAYGQNRHVDILNRWQKEGDITDVPRMDYNMSTDFNANSSRWLFNASHIAFKSLTLSYTFPQSLVNKLDLGSINMYASVENIFTTSSLKGMNPAQAISGNSSLVYDPSRIFTVGINLSF